MRSAVANKVCLVTGGARGIGWALVQALADHEATVYTCDISRDNLALAKQEVAGLPWADRITFSNCDVADRQQVERWISAVLEQTGRVDVLINNAAFIQWQDVTRMSVEDAERTMRVGYDGMVYTTKAVLPHMQAARQGHIVNIGSVAGRVFVNGPSAAYAAMKAAVDGYTQILQLELAGSGIAVTLVRPAAVAGTDFFGKHVAATRMPRFTDFVPYLTPPQVAAAILRALHHRRRIVNLPSYLPVLYLAYDLAPGLVRRLVAMGGPGRRDYGRIRWRYP